VRGSITLTDIAQRTPILTVMVAGLYPLRPGREVSYRQPGQETRRRDDHTARKLSEIV
jgi:hypothetical protein